MPGPLALARAQDIPKTLPAKGFFGEEAPPEQYTQVVKSFVSRFPEVDKVKIKPVPGLTTGAYSPRIQTVFMGTANPAILAHELGHAVNVKPDTLYSKIISASRIANRLNSYIAVPLALGSKLFLSPDAANTVLNYGSLISALLAAPTLSEEFGATVHAVRHSPEKLKALKALGPAYLSHLAVQTFPFSVYQFTRAAL